ncbi:1386_t:CDS:1 [Dentiscutata heterogama]|uniref:1386_t:CDS:1 n=1 Tax=Dentiscutata heterogama TaxID=1316150 RepID=A0ACA9L7K4_9GLOM|nr:1386_t:CDS:1 [Dentiscutata heterogama]
MATIKVVYGSVSRRFTIGTDTTWSNLESQFRSLFQIPSHAQLIATYIDEDGDNVALSSDLELAEVLSQCSAGTAIKIILKTKPTIDETAAALEQISLEDEESYETIFYSQSEPEETEGQGTCKETCGEICEDVTYSADEAHEQGHIDYSSSDPEIYFFVSRKRSHRGPRRIYAGSAKPESFGGQNACPFAERFRGPYGRGHARMHRMHKHVEPGHHHRGHRFRGHRHPYKMCKRDGGHENERVEDKTDKGPEMNESGPSTREDHHHGHHMHHKKCDKKAKFHSSGDERPRHHCARVHAHPYFHHKHGHGHHGRHGDHGEIPPEKIAEKLEILNGLSFPAENNSHYEELLKRYHGRIGQVVEAVIREQREKEPKEPKEPEDDDPEGDEGQASTSQPMQS